MRAPTCCLALICGWLALAACTTDASLTKDVVGTWMWKPSQQLPKEKVRKAGFVTPDLEAVQFGADGRFVLVQTLPGYDTDVAGTTVHVPEYWTECHGSWSVASGQLSLKESPEDRWAARHDSTGWRSDPNAQLCGMYSYKIVDHQRHRLQLQAVAIDDYDRPLERSSTMPERPALSKP